MNDAHLEIALPSAYRGLTECDVLDSNPPGANGLTNETIIRLSQGAGALVTIVQEDPSMRSASCTYIMEISGNELRSIHGQSCELHDFLNQRLEQVSYRIQATDGGIQSSELAVSTVQLDSGACPTALVYCEFHGRRVE